MRYYNYNTPLGWPGPAKYKSNLEGSLLCWSSHHVILRIQEGESSAVERNTQDCLVRDGAQLEEIVPGVVNVQDLILSTLTRPGFQWGIVSSLLVPLTYTKTGSRSMTGSL